MMLIFFWLIIIFIYFFSTVDFTSYVSNVGMSLIGTGACFGVLIKGKWIQYAIKRTTSDPSLIFGMIYLPIFPAAIFPFFYAASFNEVVSSFFWVLIGAVALALDEEYRYGAFFWKYRYANFSDMPNDAVLDDSSVESLKNQKTMIIFGFSRLIIVYLAVILVSR